jgi:sulfur-oxidizing protein SoxY
MTNLTRRDALLGIGSGLLLIAVAPQRAWSTDADTAAAISKATDGAPLNDGRVELTLPPLVESGNSVPLTVRVQSPLTAQDYVRRIMIFADRNPRPRILAVTLGPRAGKAEVTINIRLSGPQNVIAVAELSDGSFWVRKVNVLVTIGACDGLMMRY